MSKIIDISPPLTDDIAVWPGDVPFSYQRSHDIREGANITLGDLRATLHLGAHADGPCHYRASGAGIGERPLHHYYGPCQVISVELPRGARIEPQHLKMEIEAPRVLFRTGSYPDPRRFNEDFNSLSAPLIEFLHARGVILVGIDTPSIDPFADKRLEAHQTLAERDLAVLEGLVLEAAPPGRYTLIALPLKIMEGDASPVRAVLLPL